MPQSAIIIGASPSLKEFEQLETLADSNYQGYILACDRILERCYELQIIPDYVFTIEDMKILSDYFPPVIRGRSTPKVKCSLRTKQEVRAKIMNQGYPLTTWDWKYLELTPNVGLMAFCFAWKMLELKTIALIGMQTSIDKPNIPPFPESSEAFSMYYEKLFNPDLEENCYLVKAVHGYWRETFLDFLELCPLDVVIYNCSEKGSLFHHRIITCSLEEYLGYS